MSFRDFATGTVPAMVGVLFWRGKWWRGVDGCKLDCNKFGEVKGARRSSSSNGERIVFVKTTDVLPRFCMDF